jgi:predicted dehydrogenase
MMDRRSLLAGFAVSLAASETGTRVVIIGNEGHVGEVTEPAKKDSSIQIVEKLPTESNYRAALDRLKPDVVAVCTHDGARADAISACIERNLPFIAEKPMAMSLVELAKLKRAWTLRQTPMTLMLPLRFTPPFLALRQIVESGQIGEVAQIDGQKSYKQGEKVAWRNTRQTFSGIVPWVGIHMLDLMRWCSMREFQQAAAIQTRLAHPEIGERENSAAALFRMDNGGPAVLRMDYLRPDSATTHDDDRLRLVGTKGIAEYQRSTGVTLMIAGQAPKVVNPLPEAQSLFAEFLKYLRKQAAPPISYDDIWRVNELVLKVRDAANSGRMTAL